MLVRPFKRFGVRGPYIWVFKRLGVRLVGVSVFKRQNNLTYCKNKG